MKLFNPKSEILKYNFVNKDNQVIPNYDLSHKEVYFELYISPDKLICIIGRLDNNYLCWYSITNLKDEEVNEEIFNFISNNNFNMYSQEYKILELERYSEIGDWYHCYITKANIEGKCWETPFGHYYGADEDNHGKYFARDIQSFYSELIEKSDYRINEGNYINILENYLQILQCESYLRLSTNKVVRNSYLKCMNECSLLYNRYMSEVR